MAVQASPYQQAELDSATELFLIDLSSPAAPAAAASDDWVDHNGAGCPVGDLARVQVQFRYDRDRRAAERSSHEDGVPAYQFRDCWTDQGARSDIVAYRVVA